MAYSCAFGPSSLGTSGQRAFEPSGNEVPDQSAPVGGWLQPQAIQITADDLQNSRSVNSYRLLFEVLSSNGERGGLSPRIMDF